MSDAERPKGSFPSIEHQFRRGQSGNPSGRPRGKSLDAKIRELLEATELPGVEIPDGKNIGDLVVVALVGHAIKGDSALMRYLIDRVCGKTPDKIQVSGGLGLDLPEALSESLRRAYGGDADGDEKNDDESRDDSAGPVC